MIVYYLSWEKNKCIFINMCNTVYKPSAQSSWKAIEYNCRKNTDI